MTNKINNVLNTVRPFLQADNGDVEFVEMSDDGIVKVKLTGSCAVCPLSIMTLRAGIERAIMKEIPGVRRVEAVE
jgi:Fe-S cluster biogenesis protein NfuA